MGEFALIRRLTERFGSAIAEGAERIGDDAVQLSVTNPVLALDTMVEGVHFRLDWSSPADVGWKLLASNFSDLHACGAVPRAWMLSLSLPGPAGAAQALAEGLGDGFEAYLNWADMCVPLVGGDTTSSRSGLVVSVTAVGVCDGGFLTRAGAHPGESVWLSGEPGWSAAGLHLLEAEGPPTRGMRSSPLVERAVLAHRRPCPGRLDPVCMENLELGAAVDVSDGLAADLQHVAQASGVRIVLDLPLPGEDLLMTVAGGDRERVRRWQLDGGEDYLLAVTSFERPGEGWTRIGAVEDGPPGVAVRDENHRVRAFEPKGWEHLR